MGQFHIRGAPVGRLAILLAVVASMGGFIFGYDTGQISDILLMDDFLKRFATCGDPTDASTCKFNTYIEGLVVSLLSVGTAIGALLGAPTADYFGRRVAMSLECAVFSIGVIIQVTAFQAWYQIMIGRFISGLGVGALSAAVPLYQAESAPKQLRGSLTGTYQLFITFGILVAYCISIGTREASNSASWRVVIAIGLVWALILGVGILFMPESPRWLLKRGRVAEAESSIARVRGFRVDDHDEHVLRDLREMQDSVKYEQSLSHAGWLDCFRPQRKTLYRTLLGMSLQSLQQLTGANYFFYYGATVFNSVGIEDSFVTQIILGAVNFGCTFLGLYAMERFGRRVPLIIGGVWQACWLFVFAAAGTARDPTLPENQGIGKLMIVSACLFILGYASTWAPGVWILIGETFPTRTRAKQGAIATASNWIWNFLIAFFTPLITRRIAYRYGFIFASCNLLGAIVVFFFLYESSGLSLEAVDVLYNDPNVKPWTSRNWQPPADYGYSGRGDLVDQTRAQDQNKPVMSHVEKAPGETGSGSGSNTARGSEDRSVEAMYVIKGGRVTNALSDPLHPTSISWFKVADTQAVQAHSIAMLLSRIRLNTLRQARFKASAPLSTRASKILSAVDLPTKGSEIPGVYDGKWGGSGKPLKARCPSTGEHLGDVLTATPSETKHSLERSREAYKSIRNMPAPRRGELIRQIRVALAEKRDDLGALVSLEMGKIRTEGEGEVQEFVDICDYAVGLSRMMNGRVVASERPGHSILEVPNPLGVVGVLSAFNFPVAVYGWNLSLSLAAGNATLWKPSPTTPLCAIATTKIISRVLERNGVDPAVAGLVCGREDVGKAVVASPLVDMISFTGSEAVGKIVGKEVQDRFGKVLLELGGNNASIIMPDADLALAIPAVLFGAVGTAGQRCTSTRRLYVHRSIASEFLERLQRAYASVTKLIGDPLTQGTLMGPLHTANAVKTYSGAVDLLRSSNADVLAGGNPHTADGALQGGNWVLPTLAVPPKPEPSALPEIWTKETFAPILNVAVFDEIEQAIEWNNAVPQGLSSSLWTRDMRNVGKWIGPSGSDAGIVNVNVGTSGAEIGAAFGGNKSTGWGRESGGDAWKQYVRWSACTLNFSDEAPLAQGVNFDLK